MPEYCFKCSSKSCADEFSIFRQPNEIPKWVVCKKCGSRAKRDFQAEQAGKPKPVYPKEILSDAMGIHPNQVAEHRRRFPDINITDDGRVRLRNQREKDRVMKKLGFIDRDD